MVLKKLHKFLVLQIELNGLLGHHLLLAIIGLHSPQRLVPCVHEGNQPQKHRSDGPGRTPGFRVITSKRAFIIAQTYRQIFSPVLNLPYGVTNMIDGGFSGYSAGI